MLSLGKEFSQALLCNLTDKTAIITGLIKMVLSYLLNLNCVYNYMHNAYFSPSITVEC